MTELMVTMMAALAGELLLVLFVLLLVAWFRGRAARRRDSKAIRVLVTRIKNSKGEREATIERYLGERAGLSGEPLQQAKTAILRAELVLLQRFAGVYKKRDAGAAAQFDIDLAAAVVPYHELPGDGIVVATDEAAADTSELEELRVENARLSEELSVTMETMSRMLNEYSSMFAGGAEGVAGYSGTADAGVAGTDEVGDSELETEPAAPPSNASLEDGAGVDIMAQDDIGAEDDGAAAAAADAGDDAEVDVPAGDEIGIELDGANDTEGAEDVIIRRDEVAEAVAEDHAVAGENLTEQDDIDALFAAENGNSDFDEPEQDAPVGTAADEPDPNDMLQEPSPQVEMPGTSEPEPETETAPDPVSDAQAVGREQGEVTEESAGLLDGDVVEPAEVADVLDEVLEDAPVEVTLDGVAGAEATQTSGEAIGRPDDSEMTVDGDETALTGDEEPQAVEIEAGDDLETVTELLEEEGPAEVVAFDELGEFDGPGEAGDLVDSAGGGEHPDLDDLFDSAEEPLKTRIGQ